MPTTLMDKVRQYDDPFNLQQEERRKLITGLEGKLGYRVAVLYHNLESAASIGDDDADILEAVLSSGQQDKPLLLMINSNGGLPLAAERLVHVIRTYAPKGFCTLVVQKAKSAATMVCLGSDKIYMTETAELGPIESQIIGHGRQYLSVDSYLDAYDNLMNQARSINMNTESPAGVLQQLSGFDPAHVEEMRKARELCKDISRKFLRSYMMNGQSGKKSVVLLKLFLSRLGTNLMVALYGRKR